MRAYVEPDGPFYLGGEDPGTPGRVVEACAGLVEAARVVAVPVVWTVVRFRPDLADGGWFPVKVPALACFAEGAPGGFRPVVVDPARGDRTAEVHEHNLADLDAKYADVVGLETALAALAR